MLTSERFPACRLALAHIVERTLALSDYLSEGGAVKSFNVDNLLLRESMDVIGGPSCPCHWSPACSLSWGSLICTDFGQEQSCCGTRHACLSDTVKQ